MNSENQTGSTNYQISYFAGVLIAVAAIFGVVVGVGGFYTATYFSEDKNQNESAQGGTNYVDPISDSEVLDFEYIESVLNYLNKDYIEDFSEASTTEDRTYGAIKGIIESLEDPYTSYLTPEDAEAYFSDRSPNFEGIGVTLAFDGDYTYIESVFSGFPAEKSGILSGDVILKVDEQDMQGVQPAEVANLVRGEKGTVVSLELYRESGIKQIEVTRDTIDIDNIMWKDLGDGIIEISIIQFSDVSVAAFNSSWDKVVDEIVQKNKDIKGIVIDLRGNPGGYVEGVKYILQEFLPKDAVLFGERMRNIDDVFFKDKRDGAFEDIPLVVMVNQGSASASEIMATSLQENDRAEIVGTKTVGKGVEQKLITLSDGGLLFIVFQKWITPNGNEISTENPVIPDVEVDRTEEDFKKGIDPQEKEALEVLMDLI